jgi:hypothetical protein
VTAVGGASGALDAAIHSLKVTTVDAKNWLKMPAVADGSVLGRLRPKYPLSSRAILVYHIDSVYVLLADGKARAEVERHSDVRRPSSEEVQELEETHPFLPFVATDEIDLVRGRSDGRALLLGDVVSRLAKAVGIVECAPCKRRRTRLNNIPLWGWWRT